MTFNEPRVVAALGFDNGINPPNRCSKQFGNCTDGNSATEPYIAVHPWILSHAEAVKRYRKKYQVLAPSSLWKISKNNAKNCERKAPEIHQK
ncbi:hypothetical protein Goarm_020889 [Gossypium armourianum]|uniref:Uncharacterized protein n=1 Tax=Gossypium armourianum TaxID=34283 RepID=A0A7J9IQY4_9ROSI|nr:hypothetical protein [Gossypium armourianum]